MGMFTTSLRIIGPNGLTEDVDALVGAGANRTALPASLLRRLGVMPQEKAVFRVATGATAEQETGEVEVEWDGRRKTVPVVFNADAARPLLGVDPVERRLTPIPGLLM